MNLMLPEFKLADAVAIALSIGGLIQAEQHYRKLDAAIIATRLEKGACIGVKIPAHCYK